VSTPPPLEISCSFPPSLSTPAHAAIAEALGYSKVWLYDGPALYADIWVTLARVAESTSTIGVGAGVLVPSLRHVMTNAAAIATLAAIAPGRLSAAVGTGFGGTLLIGERPVKWAVVAEYLRALRGLLAGETVEYDGRRMAMLHPDDFGAPRPIGVPIIVAANGPRGIGVASELGDGVYSYFPQPEFSWSAVPLHGTVLDPDESLDSPRVLEVGGVGLTMLCHAFYESPPPGLVLEDLPGGAEWCRAIDALPEDERHLSLHEAHLVGIAQRDRVLLHPESVGKLTFTGTAEDLRGRLDELARGGATEVVFGPSGPDLERELHAFAAMAGSLPPA
jgi:5,10-methylenetetrahydromethanopterin reductase